ncbi:SRPBCC family protein [Rhodococcus artemisiae]|uniref:SRPBCC family protein n=1 Tax=Rhodococcus artemisiae TaxID=714159 RepID=A0ABU7LCS4_9NOCA|nr:SRPBCC family protein [Rhodococcus artemisiae]MEE2059357.1 SRPBCC family protein [Rhodococcus artemisiae]
MEQRITVTRSIAAPPSAVWAVLTDLDSAPDTLRGVTAVERVEGGGEYRVGTRWRETRVMFGKSATEELQVTESVPEQRTVITAESGRARYRTVIELTPTATGTDLTMEFSGDSGPLGAAAQLLMTVTGPLAKRATAKSMRQDLEDIAAVAERLG